MLDLVTPHLRLASVLELEPDHLRSLGLEGLLLDVDCTLKDYDDDEFGAGVLDWTGALRASSIRLCLVSNGRRGRIAALARKLEVPFVANAFKPFPFGCRRALETVGLDSKRVAVIGDQLFADVLAGRLAGLYTILVHPTSPVEPWFTRLKRPLERQVLRRIEMPSRDPATPPGFPEDAESQPQ